VADEGPGIEPERIERIFDRFYSASSDGTGLGLAIGREIARAHGGELTAHNEARGAVFCLTLPASPKPHPRLIGTSSDVPSVRRATTPSTGGD
jgi:signal transduction histidine kinase